MDFKSKGRAWVGNICQKIETLCLDLEVDEIIAQDPLKSVEKHLATMSENVKQFCSEFIEEVLPPYLVDSSKDTAPDFSKEQNDNNDSSANGSLKIDADENPHKELYDENTLPHVFTEEHIDDLLSNAPSKQNNEIGMYKQPDVDSDQSSLEEKSFASGIPIFSSHAKEDTPADFSSALPSGHSVSFPESCKGKLSSSGVTSNNALSALPNYNCAAEMTGSMEESSWSKFDLNNDIVESEDHLFLADNGIETTDQSHKRKLDESGILVNSHYFSDSGAKHQSFQVEDIQKTSASRMKLETDQEWKLLTTSCDHLDAETDEQIKGSSSPSFCSEELESVDRDYCESEWVLV